MSRLRKSAFDRCVEEVEARGTAYDPRAVCATIGRRKYGQAEMTRRSIAGKRRAARGNPVKPDLVLDGFEYWVFGSEVYRNQIGNRGYITPQGIPSGVRWETSVLHWNRYHPDYPLKERRTRSNPYEAAAELSEAFHGRPAESVEVVETPLHEHSTLTKLARLVSLELKDAQHTEIEFDANTRLSSNEAGTQLYIDGGNQSVNLSQFPEVDETKEAVPLGKVKKIAYWTAKYHLDRRDETPGPYTHTFGEESGDQPTLHYDTVNRLLSFVGGHYYIDLDMPGGYSAGIRD
jgi:hypothetical protein